MTREEALAKATDAARRAAALAGEAERHAHHPDHPHKVAPLAAAGALWADVARAHVAIATELRAEIDLAGGSEDGR
ncbi:hypothetical protein [Streptomyces gibsoniae]|uniref:Uncharacterized protein n=1 Tax=Streptomyces gibsoniae TaxID=3075529 RepID=A0ABU2U954_9ACTN|nr:hypothetical protein [Streptomyces sp. DSM 41699]MDT0469680.1 hypothetical protein [Streptomyces sp. DSM 41699]